MSRAHECTALFKLDPAFFAKARSAVKTLRENGGNTRIDYKTRTISEGETSKGEYNAIRMSRGVVDWHTHPRDCESSAKCAVGVPSHIDLVNIALGSLFGTQAHILFSSEGTYVLRISKKTAGLLASFSIHFRSSKRLLN